MFLEIKYFLKQHLLSGISFKSFCCKINQKRTVIVAQLVEWLLPTLSIELKRLNTFRTRIIKVEGVFADHCTNLAKLAFILLQLGQNFLD